MKKLTTWCFFALILFGCKNSQSNTNTDLPKTDSVVSSETVSGKNYFDFDEIEHYFNDFPDERVVDLIDESPANSIDSIRAGLLIGHIPQDIYDTFFINKLQRIGFIKNIIDKHKFSAINKVFSEKKASILVANKCVPVFRDIMIFKKNKKTIGIVKICFGCRESRILGTTANTDDFGQMGEYENLKAILEK